MSDLPIFIARPSGVWNIRAPLDEFNMQSHRIRSDFSVLTLAVARTRYLLAHRAPNDNKTSVRKYIVADGAGHMATHAWTRYRDSWRTISSKHDSQPSFDDIDKALATSLYAVRENSIARYSSIFETFVQCWALNMMLAYLENGEEMPEELENLARGFSPFRQRYVIPTVPMIFKAFRIIDLELDNLPHINKDPITGEQISEPIDPNLSAKSVVLFWRDFRNSVVHGHGRITHAFCDKHFHVFEALRHPYRDTLRALEPGTRLQLPDMVFALMATTHSKTAAFLNEHLQTVSRSRGGVQSEESIAQSNQPIVWSPLLTEGDHPISLRWLRDPIWREELLAKYPRKWHKTQGEA